MIALPCHPCLRVRRGRLDREGFRSLFAEQGIRAVVDASHPFAKELRQELSIACLAAGIPRLRYERPSAPLPSWAFATDSHREAAVLAASFGKPILLTTGSRNLAPYAEAACQAGVPLHARILPTEESRRDSAAMGLDPRCIEFARGPFTVEETAALLARWKIGVLVAKDGGLASGLAERLEAVRRAGIEMVVVRRPEPEPGSFRSIATLLEELQGMPT